MPGPDRRQARHHSGREPEGVDPTSDASGTSRRSVGDGPIAELGARLARDARRRAAEATILDVVRSLDEDRWHVEESVVAGPGVHVSFVLAGPTGLFVVVATDCAWCMADIRLIASAAKALSRSASSYPGGVRAAIVVADTAAEPRQWFAEDGSEAWVLGARLLPDWLHSFPREGFALGDIARLRQASPPTRDQSRGDRLGVDLSRPGPLG
jgi:hypothetical protein